MSILNKMKDTGYIHAVRLKLEILNGLVRSVLCIEQGSIVGQMYINKMLIIHTHTVGMLNKNEPGYWLVWVVSTPLFQQLSNLRW